LIRSVRLSVDSGWQLVIFFPLPLAFFGRHSLGEGFWLLASLGRQSLGDGGWLLASGFWLLASGFWLLAKLLKSYPLTTLKFTKTPITRREY
jgi:hypothetical protein